MLTFLAALDMSPELGSSANLDRLHHAPLNPVDVAGVGNAPCFTVTTKDVRYFEFRPEHVSHLLSSPPPRSPPRAGRPPSGRLPPPGGRTRGRRSAPPGPAAPAS